VSHLKPFRLSASSEKVSVKRTEEKTPSAVGFVMNE
jgi:hypothetical protein